MCRPVLVIKRVCRHGHLNDWTSCWAPCDEQARANYNENNFNQLCDEDDDRDDSDDFKEIKSYAKEDMSPTLFADCEACRSLAGAHPQWGSCERILRGKQIKLDECERLRDLVTERVAEVTNSSGSSELIAQWNSFLVETLEHLAAFRQEFYDASEDADRASALYADQAIVDEAHQRLRSLELSRWRSTDLRRFFLGDTQRDEANVGAFERGVFDERLIVEYPEQHTSIPDMDVVDLSPPNGIIGELSIDQIFDDWRERMARADSNSRETIYIGLSQGS